MLSMSEAFALPKRDYQPLASSEPPEKKKAEFYQLTEKWEPCFFSDITDFLETDDETKNDLTNKLGYHGACYRKTLEDGKVIYAFTHKGTNPKDIRNLSADSTIAVNLIPKESRVGERFVSFCMGKLGITPKDTTIYHLGHSLGGFHAQLIGYLHGTYVCSFDNPGAWTQAAAWVRQQKPTNPPKEPDPTQAAKHLTILSIENPVNAHGIPIGNGFFLPPAADKVAPVKASKSKLSGLEHHPFNYLIGFLKQHTYPDIFADGFGLAEPFMPLNARKPSSNPGMPIIQHIADEQGNLVPVLHSHLTSPKNKQPVLIYPEQALIHLTYWPIKPARTALVIERLTPFGTANIQCIQHTKPNKHQPEALVITSEENHHRFVQHYNPRNTISFLISAEQIPRINTLIKNITDEDFETNVAYETWQGDNFPTVPNRFKKLWSSWMIEQLAAVGITPSTEPLESRHLNSSAKNTARATQRTHKNGGSKEGTTPAGQSRTKQCVIS